MRPRGAVPVKDDLGAFPLEQQLPVLLFQEFERGASEELGGVLREAGVLEPGEDLVKAAKPLPMMASKLRIMVRLRVRNDIAPRI